MLRLSCGRAEVIIIEACGGGFFVHEENDKATALKPALFLHIQKTAGTAIFQMALKHYGYGNLISHGDYMGHIPQDAAHVPFVSGHFGYDFARALMPGRYSFTFLRDPIERVLSLYYFCREQDPNQFSTYKLAHELDLDDYLLAGLDGSSSVIRAHIWNNQVWQLACGFGNLQKRQSLDYDKNELLELAISHVQEFSYIGFKDTIDADSAVIFSELGIPPIPELPKFNVTNKKPSYLNLPASTKELLKELTSLDQQLYDHARANRANRAN